jgi:hypothetical protein
MENIQSAIDVKGAGIFNQAEQFFGDLFVKKAPPLPAQFQDILVKLAPFWAIALIIFAVIGIVFGALGTLLGLFTTLLSIFSLSLGSVISSLLSLVNTIVGLAFGAIILLYLAKSVKGLFNPDFVGWQSLFRAEVVWLVYAVVSWALTILTLALSFRGLGAIVGIGSTIIWIPIQLIFFGLSFYLLFQIKDRYARANA